MTDLDKLATAMGYVKISNYTGSFADQQGTEHWTHPEGYPVFEVPDPENDANDDYAVLEWARSGHRDDGKQYLTSDQFVGFDLALEMDAPKYLCDYEIGDFSRAYLKSIADD